VRRLTDAQLDYMCGALSRLFAGTVPTTLLAYKPPAGSADDGGLADPAASQSSTTGGAAAEAAGALRSLPELEEALVTPPVVLAVLADPPEDGASTAQVAGLPSAYPPSEAGNDSSSLREFRLGGGPATATPAPPAAAHTRPLPSEGLRVRFNMIVAKCTLQLLLLQMANDLVNAGRELYEVLGPSRLWAIANNIRQSYAFAHAFNADAVLRQNLVNAGTAANQCGTASARPPR